MKIEDFYQFCKKVIKGRMSLIDELGHKLFKENRVVVCVGEGIAKAHIVHNSYKLVDMVGAIDR